MKLVSSGVDSSVVVGGSLTNAVAGIDSSYVNHILGMLSSMYKNIPMAVIREYTTNAVDAHKEVGKENIPIRVHLPTSANPVLVVKDFGKGLTEEQMTALYLNVGSSSKRLSNDFTGGFGVGSKSVFAYTNQMEVTSVYSSNGVKTKLIYLYYKSEDDGSINLSLYAREEDVKHESTGLTVSIPIKKGEVGIFANAAADIPITHLTFQVAFIA